MSLASLDSLPPDVVESHILNRLDGEALASASCTSAQLHSLCNEDHLWRRVCNAAWPSTAHPRARAAISAHRSFYSDSLPSPHHRLRCHDLPPETPELISAVDVYCDGEPVYSKVLRTETLSSWFASSPFRLELLDPKETIPTLMDGGYGGAWVERARQRLRVSWILIDPAMGRAANVASRTAVEARVHWLNEDLRLRYATVAAADGGGLVQCAVVVSCGMGSGGDLRVKEVNMQVEDMEGKILSGRDSLVILRGAMGGERRRMDVETEREAYEVFSRTKEEFRERKLRRERGMDVVFVAMEVSIFFAILIFLRCL